MQQSLRFAFGLLALIPSTLVAGTLGFTETSTVDPTEAVNVWTGEGVDLAGILFPHAHLISAFGASTSDHIAEELAIGHHDPNRDGFTVQDIEVGSSLRLGEYVEGFVTYAAVIDQDDEWSGRWEEAFLKLKSLPGGFELRGGRYYNRFGFENAVHPHGYFFVDKNLLEGRMLGEDGFGTEGGEITWRLPTPFTSALSYSYGTAIEAHAHEHGHGHGDEHGEEALFEAEGAAFAGDLHALHLMMRWDLNDFHQFSGHLSAATGDNAFGRNTSAYTAGVEYLWRENGYEPGGRSLRWRTAVMARDIEAVSGHLPGEEEGEEDDHGDHEEEHEDHHEDEGGRYANLSEWGVSTSVIYGWNESWETGIGVSWVEGIASAGVDERLRVSPLVTYRPTQNTNIKLQYNYDRLGGSRDEHSVWLGFGLSWGAGREVR